MMDDGDKGMVDDMAAQPPGTAVGLDEGHLPRLVRPHPAAGEGGTFQAGRGSLD